MSTVIVCADSSPHSSYALEFYLKQVHQPGNTVKVIHCPDYWRDVGVMEGPSPATVMRLQKEAEEKTHFIKEEVEKMLTQYQVPGSFEELVGKHPWKLICDKAYHDHASMIVIGTRGLNKLRRTFLGSCSTSVVHHSHCPVLVCCHPHQSD